ncbi:P-loop NTPase [Halorubrum sp. Boch-26]|uniref:nucleotide-binding protein n=1 Tax=Halorubrum sp. Boch-26 TaxID=2994426 RepID=UPI002469696C|nr:P-loop NTPase [Halorubrum sp. Boch-26]
MVTVYAVASAKGGVGKTTTTAAMATILAGSGADVVAIDADIGMANLAGALGVTPGETTLHDVLAGRADPLDAVHEGPEGLRVIPGATGLDAYASADPAGLADVVAAFEGADYVFVDAGAGLSHDSSLPLAVADETLLVSTAELSALGDTEKTRQLAERLGGTVAGAAITRVDPHADPDETGAEGLDDIADVLDAAVLGRIPEDDAVVRAATANRPLPTFEPDAPATRAYRDLTRALTGAPVEGAGVSEGDDTGDIEDESGRDESGDEGRIDADEGDKGDESDEDVETGESDEDVETGESDESDGSDAEVEAQPTGDTDADDEDIIIADAEPGGLSDPGDEEDIIVADEDPVSEDDATTAPDDEAPGGAAVTDPAATGQTETVGEGHVVADDLEAMIEESETEAFDDAEATDSDDASDDPAAGDGEATPTDTGEATRDDGAAAGDESATSPDDESATDPDDELAGSVPFRDDDTGMMNTVLSEDDGDETEGETASDDERDEEEESGGFFSRLFGR